MDKQTERAELLHNHFLFLICRKKEQGLCCHVPEGANEGEGRSKNRKQKVKFRIIRASKEKEKKKREKKQTKLNETVTKP
jgi:hypothetical protein